MKKIILATLIITSLFLIQSVNALQEVAGTLIIQTPIGGSNYARYGLMNDGNDTITVSLRADGNVAQYLSFPSTVDLQPGKLVYTNITASIPADYDTSLGRSITGFIYALQEGSPGQVQINVQMMKNVTIVVTGNSTFQPVSTPGGAGGVYHNYIPPVNQTPTSPSGQSNQNTPAGNSTNPTANNTVPNNTVPGNSTGANQAAVPTGFVSFVTGNQPLIFSGIALIVIALAVFSVFKIRNKKSSLSNPKPQPVVAEENQR
jgi:hypothetical protein